MAKLRRNYESGSGEVKGMVRISIFAIILLGLLYFGYDRLLSGSSKNSVSPIVLKTAEGAVSGDGTRSTVEAQESENDPNIYQEKPWLPNTKTGEIVDHTYYTLSYVEAYEQAEWVSYPLTQELLRKPNVSRTDYFFDDPKVSTGSATYYDYKGSGYTKGHLAPAADMAFDTLAMRESFYMSNMSPQLHAFNNGVWRELEEQTRDWTYHNKSVYIVSGPVFGTSIRKTKKGIAIPDYFYKIILDVTEPDRKGIAFLIPHRLCEERLQDFVVSIDSVESVTGIDFFGHLPGQAAVDMIETNADVNKWKFSEDRYLLRVSRWNKE